MANISNLSCILKDAGRHYEVWDKAPIRNRNSAILKSECPFLTSSAVSLRRQRRPVRRNIGSINKGVSSWHKLSAKSHKACITQGLYLLQACSKPELVAPPVTLCRSGSNNRAKNSNLLRPTRTYPNFSPIAESESSANRRTGTVNDNIMDRKLDESVKNTTDPAANCSKLEPPRFLLLKLSLIILQLILSLNNPNSLRRSPKRFNCAEPF